MDPSDEISKVLDSFAADLMKEIDSIDNNDFQIEKLDNYDRDNHWNKMGLCCDLVSKECTKMALAISKPPFPSVQDSNLLLRDIGKALDMLVAWYKSFPVQEGKVLHKLLQNCITSILSSVSDFVVSSSQNKIINNQNRQAKLATGTVWENCDSFKHLPKDNTSAAKKNIDDSYQLISDAIDELQQSLVESEEEEKEENVSNGDDFHHEYEDDEEKWTEDDRKLIKPCIGLMMASKGLLKKTKAALTTAQTNHSDSPSETDVLMEHLETLSPSIDDLAMMLYPPVDGENLIDQAGKISEILKNTLLFMQNSSCLGATENQSWMAFIEKAVDHNFNKLNSLKT